MKTTLHLKISGIRQMFITQDGDAVEKQITSLKKQQ
jgi:hypothetical protein